MQKDPFYQENSNAYTSRERNLIAIIIVLLIALAGTSYWVFFKKQENSIITKENIVYQSENKELISLRDSLVSQVESLSSNFAALSEENQSLQGSLNDAKNELTSKLKTLSLYKKNSAKESNSLRAEILQLLAVKAELEESISALQEENDNLKLDNQSLQVAVETSKKLSSELEERVRALELARSLEGDSEKSLDIKQKISEFVREIDKCIVLLKK